MAKMMRGTPRLRMLISSLALVALVALGLFAAAKPVAAQNVASCYTNVYEQQRSGFAFFGFGGGSSFVRVSRDYNPDCNYVGDDRVNQDNYAAAALYRRPD